LLQFTQRLVRLRHQHPVFCRRRWFQGRPIHGTNVSDIGWFTPAGTEMSEDDWRAGFAKSLGVFLNGRGIPTPNERGEPIFDESFYVMFNAGAETLDFTIPEEKWGTRWTLMLNTYEDDDHMSEEDGGEEFGAGDVIEVEPWTLILLKRTGWRAKPKGADGAEPAAPQPPHA
jgi:glycogen operon protein